MKKEACVETLEEAIFSEKNGADRIELCSDLENDGLTPCKELIRLVSKGIKIPVRIMIRPRAGNFTYTKSEIEKMKASILYCKKMKVEGVVFGLLKEDSTIDAKNTKILADLAHPLKVTFHKAIDVTPDIVKSVESLSKIDSISSVLTSGGKRTAKEGSKVLKMLVEKFDSTIDIISAGKIQTSNFDEIHKLIQGTWYHGRRIVEVDTY